MRLLSLGLRARLMLLVLFAVAPAFGVIGYSAIVDYEHANNDAKADAMNVVRLAAREQTRIIADTRELLVHLARQPALRQLDTPGICNRFLAETHKSRPYYTNIGVATPDGNVRCSALPLTQKIDITDRLYFRRALQSRDFSIGGYTIGRLSGKPVIAFGYPILDVDRKPRGVAFAALPLDWFDRLLAGIELSAGSALTVVDDNGIILAHHPEPGNWVGQSLRDAPLVDAIIDRQAAGTIEVRGPDDVERLYAFAPLYDNAAGKVYVAVGLPASVAYAEVYRDLLRNLALLGLAAVLAFAAAWIGGNVFILRRVQALADAAERLGRGDLTARTGIPHGREELGQLARKFDDMAGALQRVNRALKTLSAGNHAMLRATDERQLLLEMCRIIVEIGDYKLAWIGAAEQDDARTIRPVAERGFNGGLPALATMVAGITWADTTLGHGAVGTAIRTGRPRIARDFPNNPDLAPWREEAMRHGLGSCAAFPLRIKGQVVGALAIYAPEPNGFDTDELALLEESANDLAFGMEMLRARAEVERAEGAIRHLAYYDQLTGLPNHAQFEEYLRRALSAAQGAPGEPLALIVLGLNRLREVNDALGFHHGDMLLKDVAKRIRTMVSDAFMVARMRGDEFAMLVPVTGDTEAAKLAKAMLDSIRAPFSVGDVQLDVSAAAGIAISPRHGSESAQLLRNADVAMQQAKKTGEDLMFYAAGQEEDSKRRLTLAGELHRAIEGGELTLHYQPKIAISTGRVCGAEALVRWQHPDRGMIRPDEFISLAEYTGLIRPITDWVLSEALRQAAAWRKAGIELPIAVNLSPRNLRDVELLDKLNRVLAMHGAKPEWLEIEITEGAVMDDPAGALNVLNRLSELGIKLFIDDFGTGYSSLGYLNKLPVDAVKIDKSFVFDMLTSPDADAIVRSTIDLAHDLDLKVVAEGVEKQAMLERLATLHCDMAQGYYFSKPLPAEQFGAWWIQHTRN